MAWRSVHKRISISIFDRHCAKHSVLVHFLACSVLVPIPLLWFVLYLVFRALLFPCSWWLSLCLGVIWWACMGEQLHLRSWTRRMCIECGVLFQVMTVSNCCYLMDWFVFSSYVWATEHYVCLLIMDMWKRFRFGVEFDISGMGLIRSLNHFACQILGCTSSSRLTHQLCRLQIQ